MEPNKSEKKTSTEEQVDFGFESVAPEEKTRRVGDVFKSVAKNYDIMNDLMSMGVHRLWKRQAISQLQCRAGMRVLDVAAGTGDLTQLLWSRLRGEIDCVMTDINPAMLEEGRDRLFNSGITEIKTMQVDASDLPFADNSFDRVMIGFGLRNVTDKSKALHEFARVLKPGGMALVLEFSKPILPLLEKVYNKYSFSLLPWLGKVIAQDEDSYRYLAESIRKHPDQETLKQMLQEAGMQDCEYRNLTGGIVALHWGRVY